jgi:hypothetical protein
MRPKMALLAAWLAGAVRVELSLAVGSARPLITRLRSGSRQSSAWLGLRRSTSVHCILPGYQWPLLARTAGRTFRQVRRAV